MAALLLLFLPLLIVFAPSAAQTNSTGTSIRLGSSLTASVSGSNSSNTTTASWTSPSGDFAFGFYPLAPGDNNSTGFLLAIWFANLLPDKTLVWWGNGGNPVQAGSKLELSTNGQLVLYDHRENEVWRRPGAAATSNNSVAVSAAMLDTGNFVLRGSQQSESSPYWSSFDEPTNTILPSQVLEFSGKLSTPRRTVEDGDDYADPGRFELRMLPDGNLVLNTIALPTIRANDAYYVSDTKDRGQRVVFNSSGDIYIAHREGGWTSLSNGSISNSTRDFFHRATLDSDGVFRHYVRPKRGPNSAGWSPIWFIPSSICYTPAAARGSGICGFNSLCVEGEEDGRYECQCPTGYIALLSSADGSTRCKPRFSAQACELDSSRAEEFFDMETIANTDWPNFDYERITSSTEEECKDNCLRDCLCNVAIASTDGDCWKKKLPMSNGRQSTGDRGPKAFIKIWKGSGTNSTGPTGLRPSSRRATTNISGPLLVWGSLLLGGSSFVNLLFLAAAMVAYHFSFHKKLLGPKKDLMMGKNLRMFTYKELVQITGGFKEELGRGAYGTVYKGLMVLSEHDHTPICVAVKKLEAAMQRSEKEVRSEVSAIGRTHHKNLVRLLGFCDEAPNRLLVYEFLKNGTLASYLFHGDIPKPRWNDRLQIASGIASGLAYLHEECISKIMHCDVKPENVLLDDKFNPKISDFGLAKLMRADQTRSNTGFRGTRGYAAPEWYRKMPVTVKVDVYSFGIMLLEMVCCRRNVEMEMGRDERVILLDWAYRCYEERQIEKLVEEDEEAKQEVNKVERLVKVAMWCVQEEPSLRPAMHKVVQMLEGAVEVPSPPHPSSFLSALG